MVSPVPAAVVATVLVSLVASCNAAATPPRPLVGMMYEGWHAPAYWGNHPFIGPSVEAVVRSNGTQTLADVDRHMNKTLAKNFYWHSEPAGGRYCIYRKRANESTSSCGLPDCPNITQTLSRHAAMLHGAGVDFVVVDSTNIQNIGPTADALQLRPWQVLAEEWLQLRRQGIPTPRIAVWQNLQGNGGNLWHEYLDGEYADPAFRDLIFADSHAGQPVLFSTESPNATVVAEIEARNVSVVRMWALHREFAQGAWSFFSPCTTPEGQFTTSVPLSAEARCNQYVTTNASIGVHGTAITVSPSYQLSYSSLPFRAAGKLGGHTMRKQFETAFAANAGGALDYLMVSTFNEHIAQPQPNHFAPQHPMVHSMGLGADPDGGSLWVDMFGQGIARDLEPTEETGSAAWDLLLSCLRVFRSGASSCNNVSEVCCDAGRDPAGLWDNVYVLQTSNDIVLTTDDAERALLVARNYSEVCTGLGGSAVFCNYPAVDNSTYRLSPFLLHAEPLRPASASLPVFRCVTPAGRHFASVDPSCRQLAVAESVLGYAARSRTTETPRSLRLCQSATRSPATAQPASTFSVAPEGAHGSARPSAISLPPLYHSVDEPCADGDLQLEYLGHVH